MKLKSISLLVLSFYFVLTGAQASPAKDLMTKLKNTQSYQADFEQTIVDEKDKVLQSSKGILYIQRPGRFHWKSHAPDELIVVADGQVIWTYDVELEQVIKQDQNASLGQSPAALLAGDVVDLDKDYDIVLLSTSQCEQGTDECFKLIPKSQESQFKIIKIGFHGDKLTMIYMKDALDQSITTYFSQIQINIALDANLFVFTPPPGVDVLQGSA